MKTDKIVEATTIDKKTIVDRIAVLESDRERLRQSLIMYDGALEDCRYWLTELEKTRNVKDNTNTAS